MATPRHRQALVVLGTCAGLVLTGTVPASASTTPVPTTADMRVLSDQPTNAAVATAGSKALARRLAGARAAGDLAAAPRVALARAAAQRAAAARRAAAAAAAAAATPAPAPTSSPVTEVPAPLAPVVAPVADATSPSGEAAPQGDLPGWKQVYVEDFTRANVATGSWPGAYTDHWYAYSDGIKDTSKNGTYMPSKVLSVHDGVLDYHVRTENGQHLVSAPVVKDTYGQVYGRYAVRFRADNLPGYKNAWLLWPDSERWPDHGEIDFPEGDLNGNINAFAHYASASGGQDAFGTGRSFRDWHTAVIEWLPGKVTFSLDGVVVGTSTKNVPATAMHWVLQTETALSGTAPGASVNGHVLVDWVALWKRA